MIRTVPLSPRFAIREQHGASAKQKSRLIEDFEISEANSQRKLADTSTPNALGAMFAMARAFAISRPRVILMLIIMDFAHAYNLIGLGRESRRFAVIALAAPSGQVTMAYLNAQPFGPRMDQQIGPA